MYAPKKTVERARDLRGRMSLPEVLLWGALRGRRLGDIRFRRQHPVGPFILDFYCEAARLAVEIDGAGHDHPDQARHDARRTEWLALRGITVMRVSARAVLDNREGVLTAIHDRILNPPPSGRWRGALRAATEGADPDAACAVSPLHRFAVPLPRWGRIVVVDGGLSCVYGVTIVMSLG